MSYNQADSLRFADSPPKALELEGYSVVREQVDFGVPNMDAAVIDMRSKGVDIVFDTIDSAGNVTLCKSMDANDFQVKAKVTSVQSWGQSVATDFAASPTCRRSLYATATDLNYADTSVAEVARFRADMHAAFPEQRPAALDVGARGLGIGPVAHRRHGVVRRPAHPGVRRVRTWTGPTRTTATAC